MVSTWAYPCMKNEILHFLFLNQTCKMFKGAVISSFRIVGKAAARQLPAFEMITETFAADALTRTGIIATVT